MTRPGDVDQTIALAAWVGIDGAGREHDLCLTEAASRRTERQVPGHRPEELDRWATELRERFAGRPPLGRLQ